MKKNGKYKILYCFKIDGKYIEISAKDRLEAQELLFQKYQEFTTMNYLGTKEYIQ